MTMPDLRQVSRTTLLLLWASVILNTGLVSAILFQPTRPAVERVPSTAPSDQIAELEGETVPEGRLSISFPDDRPTLLYVMSPECSWCKKNEANFAEIVRTQNKKYRIVLVSLVAGGFADYYAEHLDDWPPNSVVPIVVSNSGKPGSLRVTGTPSLLVVSPSGVVEAVWSGAITETRSEVEGFFGITLPGISK